MFFLNMKGGQIFPTVSGGGGDFFPVYSRGGGAFFSPIDFAKPPPPPPAINNERSLSETKMEWKYN